MKAKEITGLVQRPAYLESPIYTRRISDEVSEITITIRHGGRDVMKAAFAVEDALNVFFAQ